MASDSEKLLAEVTDRMKREAYAAGWRDAMSALGQAMGSLAPPNLPEGTTFEGFEAPAQNGKQSVLSSLKQGTTPYYVMAAVLKQPGMTGGQIVEAVKAAGHPAPEGSIRTNIQRLKDRKFIVLRHNKWFPE